MTFKRATMRYGETPEPVTPYQKAAQVWDERIGSARAQAHNWRLMALGSLVLSLLLAGLLLWIGRSATTIPYIVEVDPKGGARAAGPAVETYKPSDAQIAFHLARFVDNVRSLSIDPVVVRTSSSRPTAAHITWRCARRPRPIWRRCRGRIPHRSCSPSKSSAQRLTCRRARWSMPASTSSSSSSATASRATRPGARCASSMTAPRSTSSSPPGWPRARRRRCSSSARTPSRRSSTTACAGTTYIVDRLFAAAELRLGSAPQRVVRIIRTDAVWRETQQ